MANVTIEVDDLGQASIVTTSQESVDVDASLQPSVTLEGDFFNVSDLTQVVDSIGALRQVCAYAWRSSEAEALTPIKGSNTPINNNATFSSDGFTGNGTDAYIDSNWSPSIQGVWATQMWCGWIKSLNNGDVGALIGVSDYIAPNYASILLLHDYYGSGNYWFLRPYYNNLGFQTYELGTSNDFNSSDYPLGDIFIVYQWTSAGNVELWVNGRLVLQFAQSGSTQISLNIFELAYNLSGNPASYSSVTLGFSAYGSALSATEISTLYSAVKSYMYGSRTPVISISDGEVFSLSELTKAVNGISGLKQACAYASRSSEAEALTPIKGSNTPVNNGAAFSANGFTGNGVNAYIDSGFDANAEGIFNTQMWAGWVKSVSSGSVMGSVAFSNPNYFANVLQVTWVNFQTAYWEVAGYGNNYNSAAAARYGSDNNYNSSGSPLTDLFIVYQWTSAGNIELWINGRLITSSANVFTGVNNLTAFELAHQQDNGTSADESDATLGFSAYGSALTSLEIQALYRAVAKYIISNEVAEETFTGITENITYGLQLTGVSNKNSFVVGDTVIINSDDLVYQNTPGVIGNIPVFPPNTLQVTATYIANAGTGTITKA